MAIDKRKTVVVYTALAVVIGTATIVGVLALTGKINLKIRADVVTTVPMPEGATALTTPPTYKRWTLLANPCPDGDTGDLGAMLGGAYIAYYNKGDTWTNPATNGVGITGDNLKRGYAYWVYNTNTNGQMWRTAACTIDTSIAANYSLTLTPGEVMAIGNPLGWNTSLEKIKVSYGPTDNPTVTSLKDLLASQAPDGSNARNKKVQLAFPNSTRGSDGSVTYTYYTMLSGIAGAGGPLEAFGDTGDARIKPSQAFYIGFAPSIGGENSVKLEFNADDRN